ncbi:MAG: 2Fe-2S iron-sulfur cluster-binding protein [Pelagimonas sp.]|jgi:2Fe-2S ferredoxin|nr:2Fe-2S iron-sulfur cluster-binding protein [Pelagimonas sp.]
MIFAYICEMDFQKPMPAFVFVSPDGRETPVDVASGSNLMQVALKHSVPGIRASCGGQCACATCHVRLYNLRYDTHNTASAAETDMLLFAKGVKPDSRLSCQVTIDPAFEGARILVMG